MLGVAQRKSQNEGSVPSATVLNRNVDRLADVVDVGTAGDMFAILCLGLAAGAERQRPAGSTARSLEKARRLNKIPLRLAAPMHRNERLQRRPLPLAQPEFVGQLMRSHQPRSLNPARPRRGKKIIGFQA